MELYSLALFMTDDCNFNCHYCYQKKGNTYVDKGTMKKAIDFFYPFLKNKCYFNFYGGEPLLAFDQIKFALDYIQSINKKKMKNIIFSMTTNGSLISDDVLSTLNLHKFSLLLSFDGIGQDVSRKKDSYEGIVKILEKTIQNPDIDLETNSVFTPSTINSLSESIITIVDLGVPNISLALSQTALWDSSSLSRFQKELDTLAKFLVSHSRKTGYIPVANFRKNDAKGVFACHAAKDRMAISADGKLWGCHLFADIYKEKEGTNEYAKFCFGDLDTFVENHQEIYPRIAANYTNLRMDQFHTNSLRCRDCPELEECQVCPMDNMIQGRNIKEIPDWVCEQKKISREIRRQFWRELKNG